MYQLFNHKYGFPIISFNFSIMSIYFDLPEVEIKTPAGKLHNFIIYLGAPLVHFPFYSKEISHLCKNILHDGVILLGLLGFVLLLHRLVQLQFRHRHICLDFLQQRSALPSSRRWRLLEDGLLEQCNTKVSALCKWRYCSGCRIYSVKFPFFSWLLSNRISTTDIT